MTLITLLSAAGMALGLGGIVPQIVRMARARSAGGQSPIGWAMALAANSTMAYVNYTAFGALIVTTWGWLAALLCATALILVTPLGRRRPALSLPPLEQLATQELVVLHDAVATASARRARR